LKQSKRQARDRNRQARKKSTGGAPPKSAAACPSCETPVQPEARFCHACGARIGESAASGGWNTPTIALYAVIGLGVAVAAAGAIFMSGRDQGIAPAPPVSSAQPAGSGQPADITAMSPREAADQLFNRVVMANEQGNIDEALQFAPMAIQAYQNVARLDADAHYHLGLIYEVMGDFDNMRNQVSIIKQYTPDHLLGLILEYSAAEKSGDPFAAARAVEAFTAAYDAEIMAGRPEYEAHRRTIENFRITNAGQ
jgi:tetratricopeptide (TPR) repeat protein